MEAFCPRTYPSNDYPNLKGESNMLKKIISLVIIFAMLIPFSSAVAADKPSAQPTVEEILNGYHEKALQANIAQETNGASTYSRQSSGSEKTLEQETVDALTTAGYEAYNVTASNYDTLEKTLKTDFNELGLDPDGSYIVVIRGEDTPKGSGIAPKSGSLLAPQVQNSVNSNSSFTYTWGNYTLTMRYVTVTANDNSRYAQADACSLLNDSSNSELIEQTLNTTIAYVLDLIGSFIPIGTVLSLSQIKFVSINQVSRTTLDLHAGANWTREYTQVYYESSDTWLSRSSVDYVQLTTLISGLYYDAAENRFIPISQSESNVYAYSQYYHDYAWRKQMAARGWYYSVSYNDYSGDVYVYYADEDRLSGTLPAPKFVFYQHTG